MSAESAVLAGRAAAEDRMRDVCRITKAGTGERVFDDGTGQYTDPAPVEVYGPATAPQFGKCRIPRRSTALTSGAETSAGDIAWKIGEYPLDLPVIGSENVRPDQIVTYLSSDMDPALVDRVFTITEPTRQSQATARRFAMREVVGT